MSRLIDFNFSSFIYGRFGQRILGPFKDHLAVIDDLPVRTDDAADRLEVAVRDEIMIDNLADRRPDETTDLFAVEDLIVISAVDQFKIWKNRGKKTA